MRLQPGDHFLGVLVGREHRIEHVFDACRCATISVSRLISVMPSTVKVGSLSALREREVLVAQHLERHLEALDHLLLIRRVLRADAEHLGVELRQILVMIAEAAGLRRAAARAGNVVPSLRQLAIGPAGHRIRVDHDARRGDLREVDPAVRRRRQLEIRQRHPLQMARAAVVFRPRQVRPAAGSGWSAGHRGTRRYCAAPARTEVQQSATRSIHPDLLVASTSPNPSPQPPSSPYMIEIHPDALHLRVVLERVHAHLAAEAALLVAAERRRRVVDVVGVDPDRAGLELARDVVRLLDVLRPDRGGQAVARVVGARDRLVDVGELDRRQHRPEDLLARDRHLRRDAVEHRRLEEVALAGADVGARAAGDERARLPSCAISM